MWASRSTIQTTSGVLTSRISQAVSYNKLYALYHPQNLPADDDSENSLGTRTLSAGPFLSTSDITRLTNPLLSTSVLSEQLRTRGRLPAFPSIAQLYPSIKPPKVTKESSSSHFIPFGDIWDKNVQEKREEQSRLAHSRSAVPAKARLHGRERQGQLQLNEKTSDRMFSARDNGKPVSQSLHEERSLEEGPGDRQSETYGSVEQGLNQCAPEQADQILEYDLESDLDIASAIAKQCGLVHGHREYGKSSRAPFEYVSSLGHGSLGVVEEVRVPGSDFPSFVRKRVQLQRFGPGKQRLKLVQQEVRSLQRLKHVHVVTIIGTYQETAGHGTSFYSILMSPVGDADLRTLLHRVGESLIASHQTLQLIPGKDHLMMLDSQEIIWLKTWFRCLASALAYIHAQGIRHQDIKPSNIIYQGQRVCLTDFSSSAQFEIGQTTSTENPAATTMMYRAPEVDLASFGESLESGMNHFPRHGRSADVFSLGCVFVEMLVVLSGSTLSAFYKSCIGQKGSYSRAFDQVNNWFSAISEPEQQVYTQCVKPLLSPVRKKRPSPLDFVANFNALDPYVTLPCPC